MNLEMARTPILKDFKKKWRHPVSFLKGKFHSSSRKYRRILSNIVFRHPTNLSFGFISLSIRDLSAILPSVFLKDSAFGYDFRKSGGNLIENLS